MTRCCRDELHWKNFGFCDCDSQRFYRSQWTNNHLAYLIIKLFLLLCWIGCFTASLTLSPNIEIWWIFFTNWGATLLLVHFLSSFTLVFYGAMIHESTRSNAKLRWFHLFTWIFHEVAFAMALPITVGYFSYIAFLDQSPSMRRINFISHLGNLIIILVDLFLCDIPFRLLHFLYASIIGAVYSVFSLILHWVGFTSAIYPVFDWANRTELAIGLVFGAAFVALPIAHSIGYGLYCFRLCIAGKCQTNKIPPPTAAFNKL